jgi:2-polyprenyl-6-methoxyphenol hydroxylase-like FAD-dependent oxidoreductase
VLANTLYRAAGDYEVAFPEYERQFKPFVEAKQRGAARFGWWFAPKTRLGVRLRNLTMNVLALPPVARRVVRSAFVDRFELPA